MRGEVEIGVLVYPEVQAAALYGLTDLFAVADRVAGALAGQPLPRLRVSHWQLDESAGAMQVLHDSRPSAEHRLNALVVPPSLGGAPTAAVLEAHRAHLRQWHGSGTLLASVCIGAFFIAASGLLDERPASTHWNYSQTLAQRYPRVRIEAHSAVLDDGDIITSAGLMAWTELGLRLVERFMGAALACETARYLAVQPLPAALPGSLFTPRLDHGDEAVLRVQHWLQGNAGHSVSVTAMAACAGLEARTFLRRFRAATGLRPTQYCQQIRVGRACRQLEITRRSVDQIAWEVGYQDPRAFRKVFQAVTGLAPSQYRQRFNVCG